MGTHFQAAVCPLCHEAFEDPANYRDHLAMVHDLVDDDGTETTLEEFEEPAPEPEPEPEPVEALEALAVEPILVVSTPQVAPAVRGTAAAPTIEHRVRSGLAIAVAVQLLVALLGLAFVSGNASDDTVTAQAAPTERARSLPPGSATTTTAPAPPVADTRNDQARAEAMLPRLEDFPAGWAPVSAEDLEEEGQSSCAAPGDPTEDRSLPNAVTGFGHDLSFVFAQTVVTKSEDDASHGMAVLKSELPCQGDELARALQEGEDEFTVTHGTFSSLGFPTYGDESLSQSMPISLVASDGLRVPMRIDFLAIRRDRALTIVVAVVGANDFTPQQERAALSAIDARMQPAAI